MKNVLLFGSALFLALLLSCASANQVVNADATSIAEPEIEEEDSGIATDAGKVVQVQVNRENVRKLPNGARLGTLTSGSDITVVKRIGNWIRFTNTTYKAAYIWAPSVGYEYQNLYSPAFYIDESSNNFHKIEYFQEIFSQRGQRRQETSSSYELFFKNLGLGSSEATILDVVTTSSQIVEHGITLFVEKDGDRIQKVRVDYYQPVKSYQNALKKSELPIKKPSVSNGGHLIWNPGELSAGLVVDLERKEWESNEFSSIWYSLQ